MSKFLQSPGLDSWALEFKSLILLIVGCQSFLCCPAWAVNYWSSNHWFLWLLGVKISCVAWPGLLIVGVQITDSFNCWVSKFLVLPDLSCWLLELKSLILLILGCQNFFCCPAWAVDCEFKSLTVSDSENVVITTKGLQERTQLFEWDDGETWKQR